MFDTILTALSHEFGKPGLSTKRAITAEEVRKALEVLPKAKSRVRVYSGQGFVPNSYRNKCQIQYLQGDFIDGEWKWHTGWSNAQRTRASGSIVVVQ
jgi:hypothetical protein